MSSEEDAVVPSSRATKRPEFDLPPMILTQLSAYIGPRKLNKLTAEQRRKLVTLAQTLANGVGDMLDELKAADQEEQQGD